MRVLMLCLCLFLGACGGGGSGEAPGDPAPPTAAADIDLLFMGNSHTSFHNLPGMVVALVRSVRPGRTVAATEAPGWMFLDDRSVHRPSLDLLRSRQWSAVVLQAQKYSTSGLFDYSIEGAVSLVRMAREQRAQAVMFPEWPRRDVPEAQRIYDLHVTIARAQPACVAPIGQAWDLALARNRSLVLHDPDGNHSAPPGAFLAALVIATTLTGTPPDQFPFIAGFGVDADTQALLRSAAAETVLAYHPRAHCPGDTPLAAQMKKGRGSGPQVLAGAP